MALHSNDQKVAVIKLVLFSRLFCCCDGKVLVRIYHPFSIRVKPTADVGNGLLDGSKKQEVYL
jgi:hypothetical protein